MTGNGKIVGSYTYLLLCRDADLIYIKIGKTNAPEQRFANLRNGCPVKAVSFSTIHVPTEEMAYSLEAGLHEGLKKWRVSGEWFRFKAEDKTAFNEVLHGIVRRMSVPSWPLRIQKLSADGLIRAARIRKLMCQRQWSKGGKAYQDFATHSGARR